MPQPAPKPVPDGMHTVTPHLHFEGDAKRAFAFYQEAFGAEVVTPIVPGPDGTGVMHAMIRIGDSNIMMADAVPGWERGPRRGTTVGMWVYVEDCDALFDRATEAGCTVIMPMDDMFWGDRMGKLKDPFGHTWAIATHKLVYTPEEIQRHHEKQLEGMF